MTGFRNFVMSCALAAASAVPPVAPVEAMPRPALDIEIKAPADIQSVNHRVYWRRGYYGGWPGYHHGYRRSGIAFYFGPRVAYPGNYYYGPRYYGPGYYPGYYPRRHYGYYPYRYYRPGFYGHRYYRSSNFGIYIGRGW